MEKPMREDWVACACANAQLTPKQPTPHMQQPPVHVREHLATTQLSAAAVAATGGVPGVPPTNLIQTWDLGPLTLRGL